MSEVTYVLNRFSQGGRQEETMSELEYQSAEEEEPWLSDKEAESILRAFLEIRRGRGATEDEIAQVLTWATKLRINEAILHLLFDGRLLIDIDQQGEIVLFSREKGVSR